MSTEIESVTEAREVDRVSHEYVVCGCKPWCRKVFDETISHYLGKWNFCSNPTALDRLFIKYELSYLEGENVVTKPNAVPNPHFIFFTHWNWKVPPEIISTYQCINFHMTALPYGRGGSPLQNLILAGKTGTTITAHRMTAMLDGGDVCLQWNIPLHGTAEEIYLRAQYKIAEMIERIIDSDEAGTLTFLPQSKTPYDTTDLMVPFKRRTPDQSELPLDLSGLDKLYDYIRMLDAQTYPRAFIDYGGFRMEFSGACRYMDEVRANVVIRKKV